MAKVHSEPTPDLGFNSRSFHDGRGDGRRRLPEVTGHLWGLFAVRPFRGQQTKMRL